MDVGDGRRDSDCDNDWSDSVKTDAVAGIFKQQAPIECGNSALCILLSMVILFAIALLHVFVDTEEHCLQSE